MKKPLLILVALVFISTLLLSGCNKAETKKIKVVTSTSLMTYIVEQVGGDYIEAINLVPPNQHPGNFDIKPEDMQKLATARLFLLHGWPGETYADNLIEAADNPDLRVIKTNVDGNWMIPSVQAAAVDKIENILSEVDPDNATVYQENAESYKQRIQVTESNITNTLVQFNVSQINIIASVRQADFLTWAGFNVVATFTNPESLSKVLQELIDTGKANNVTLVVNNLQDGEDAGISVAAGIGAVNLNLSNFPGGFSDTETWEKAIEYNINMLLDAIE
jgi:ABC-type Zn uptake system ZnuABC Zn-binding protein ZnuA